MRMKKWLGRLYLAVCLPAAVNFPIFLAERPNLLSVLLVVLTYWGLVLLPVRDSAGTSLRVRIMYGGRRLVYWSFYGMLMQGIIFYLVYFRKLRFCSGNAEVLIPNAIMAVLGLFLLLSAGVLRIFFTSKRLSIVRRFVMVLIMWIPVVNFLVLLYVCRLVYEEYDFEREKALLRSLRVDSDLCKTRYPLLMVHGVGFRDLRYFNYWGRIPGSFSETVRRYFMEIRRRLERLSPMDRISVIRFFRY